MKLLNISEFCKHQRRTGGAFLTCVNKTTFTHAPWNCIAFPKQRKKATASRSTKFAVF
jgi:hypothetical protein